MADSNLPAPSRDVFRWVCLAAAVLAVAWIGWCVNDVRLELKRSAATLNEHLPRILANTKSSTETLKVLSQDIKEVRDLAGVNTGSRDKSLVRYADSLLDLIEKQKANIGKKKLLGKTLKDPRPAAEWVVGARREAVYQSFRVHSKREMLEKLCTTAIAGRDFYIQFEGQTPQKLIDWAKANHPETRALAE